MNAKTSRRDFLRTTAAGAGSLALGGIALPRAAHAAEDVTIQFWTHDNGYIQFFTQKAAEYSALPDAKYNFTIEVTQAPSAEIVTKALTAYSARQEIPDLLGITINQFSRFMGRGVADSVLMDITDRVAPIRDEYYESVWQQYAQDGKLYGVESAYSMCVTYYREDILSGLGLDGLPETWEETVEVARNVLQPNGLYAGMVGTSGEMWHAFVMHLYQRGGALFGPDGSLTLDSPEAVEVLQFLADGLKDEVFLPVSSMFGGPTVAAIQQGKLAALSSADWFQTFVLAPNAEDQTANWRIQAMPRFSNGGANTSILGGTGFAVSKNSPNAEAAWELLRYTYLTEQGQKDRFNVIKYLPTNKALYTDAEFLQYSDPFLGGQNSMDVYASLAPNVPTVYQSQYWNDALQLLNREIAEVYNGNKTAGQGIQDAAKEIAAKMG